MIQPYSAIPFVISVLEQRIYCVLEQLLLSLTGKRILT